MKPHQKVKDAGRFLKKFAVQALLLVILPIFSHAASADDQAPASADFDVHTGDWAALSAKYPNPYSSLDLSGLNDISAAQPPESLASWWSVLDDDTLTQLISWALRNNRNMREAR